MESGREVKGLPSVHRGALICLVLISMAVNARQVGWYFHHNPLASDLRIFMTGAEMLRSGERQDLYSFQKQEKAQNRLYPETKHGGLLPFNHLAYELLMYWPLSRMPYQAAMITWAMVNLGIVFLIGHLLRPFAASIWHCSGIPIAMWMLAFYPVSYVFGEAQDSLVFLLLLVLSLRVANAGRMFLAGFLLAMALFKFHLVLLIALFVFVIRRDWKGIAGLACGGALVTSISWVLVGPRFPYGYLAMLRQQEVMTPWGFIPWFMPNLRGLLQWGLSPWMDIGAILPIIFVASVIVVIVTAWLVAPRPAIDVTLLYMLGIPAALLVSYHLHMQDLSLAILPLLVLMDRAIQGQLGRFCTLVLAVSVCLFLGFRLAAEPFQILLVRGCLLSIPLLLLWIAAACAWSGSERYSVG